MKPEILYEDESLIACVKPAGMPAQGTKSNDEDMISILKNYLYDRGDTDEEPYIAAIHRLDRPVGGIMLFAKNREIAAKLTDQVMAQDMVKGMAQQVRRQGIRDTVSALRSLRHDDDEIKRVIMDQYDLTDQDAEEYLKQAE